MMLDGSPYIKLSGELNAAELAAQFKTHERIQIRNVLEHESATRVTRLLIEQTPWGVSWQAGSDGPHRIRHDGLNEFAQRGHQVAGAKLDSAMKGNEFAFFYSQYRMSFALNEGWSRSPGHDAVVRELNGEEFLRFIREVCDLPEIRLCDAQATHFGANQFLSLHQDINVDEDEDRLVAYVLSLCPDTWRPDWGGYLNFFGPDGDIVEGYMPRFNCLNMFRVPQDHNVSYVPPFAAGNRLAITGWFRS